MFTYYSECTYICRDDDDDDDDDDDIDETTLLLFVIRLSCNLIQKVRD